MTKSKPWGWATASWSCLTARSSRLAARSISMTSPPMNLWRHFSAAPSMNILRANGFKFGFRPEHFLPKTLSDNPGQLAQLPLFCQARRVSRLGQAVYGYVSGHENELTLAKVPSNIRVLLDVEGEYEFALHFDDIRYFDAESGRAHCAAVPGQVALISALRPGNYPLDNRRVIGALFLTPPCSISCCWSAFPFCCPSPLASRMSLSATLT